MAKKKVDRGIEKVTLIPKGYWLGGGSFSYSENSADDYEFIVLNDINGTNYNFKVSPFIGYFVANDLAVGARFSYNRSMINLGSVSLDINEDLNFDVENFYNIQHMYIGSVFLRNYVALGKSKRFGIFNEVRLSVGGGQSKEVTGENNEDITGSYQDVLQMQLGLIPGVIGFLTDNVAVEASVNVLGFDYKKYSQKRDQIYEGSFESSGVNFKVDILSINIGVSFYF
ncbi:MAG: hypothetical protein IKY70_06985 [Bacteroidales bacterium]|nr:hypothetical protein [Bacteroidales bacterium]